MARGKLHFVIHYEKKTACGLDRERVNTTTHAEIVNCRKCRFTNVFWGRRKRIA